MSSVCCFFAIKKSVDIECKKHVIHTSRSFSDESIKRPSSEFKGGSVAEEGATVKPAGTMTATA